MKMLKYSVGSYPITRLYNFTNKYYGNSTQQLCQLFPCRLWSKQICICKFTKRSGLHDVMVRKICWSMERRRRADPKNWRRRRRTQIIGGAARSAQGSSCSSDLLLPSTESRVCPRNNEAPSKVTASEFVSGSMIWYSGNNALESSVYDQ